MKRTSSPAFALLFAICALLTVGASQTVSAGASQYYRSNQADDGTFVMRFSPVLGINVGLVVTINGQVAGAITKGHVFRQYLPPGRHVIAVAPNGRDNDAWETTLDVSPGQTYSYIAKYNVDEVLLLPANRFPQYSVLR